MEKIFLSSLESVDMRRELPVLLKTNEPSRLPLGEIGEESFLHCSTFDLEPVSQKSHNGYSHFSVQIYGAICNRVQRENVCKRDAVFKVLWLSSCYNQFEPSQSYFKC